jgi:hypothetical protein
MSKCTAIMPVADYEHMRATLDDLATVFRQRGQLAEEDMDLACIYTANTPGQVPKDQQASLTQAASCNHKFWRSNSVV